MRILVADDEPYNRLIARKILQRGGYEVEVAGNGREAFNACTAQFYDLVLMDCQMPDMDGLQAAKCIRELQMVQPIIIAVTGLSLHEAREKCMENLMNGYLRKPYSASELLELVSEKLTSLDEHSRAAGAS